MRTDATRMVAAKMPSLNMLGRCFTCCSRCETRSVDGRHAGRQVHGRSCAPGILGISVALSLAILLAVSALPVYGQAFGTISGNVSDPSGAVVPGAKVTATETGTSFTRDVISDAKGHYVIPNLRPTQYSLTVEAPGFQKFVQQSVNLLANQSATIDIRLQIGSAVQAVIVNESTPLVNTTTQTLSDVVERERMVELPLNGRNAVESMNLVAGVSGVSPATTTSQSMLPASARANVNGSRDNQTSYSLDGANFLDQYYNVNIPFPDALQEFSVQTKLQRPVRRECRCRQCGDEEWDQRISRRSV